MNNASERPSDPTASVEHTGPADLMDDSHQYLTIRIAGQIFGIPVLQTQDVLGSHDINETPLAPPEISGSLNLRGRIVTAIDVRKCLGLDDATDDSGQMSVVVEHEDELFSLIIDSVGDVLSLDDDHYESTPATLDDKWRNVSRGVYRLDNELLIILDVPSLLNTL